MFKMFSLQYLAIVVVSHGSEIYEIHILTGDNLTCLSVRFI